MDAILMKTRNEKTMSSRLIVTKIQAINNLVDLLCSHIQDHVNLPTPNHSSNHGNMVDLSISLGWFSK